MSIPSIYSGYNVTYSPEWGRCAVPKDNTASQVAIRWGKKFEEKLKTTLAQTSEKQTEESKNSPPRTKLSDEDIKALADKYDASCMSRNEYDSFLEELVDKGVLTHQEIKYMGYKGMVYLDLSDHASAKLTPVQINPNDPMARKWMYDGYSLFGGLFKFDGSADANEEMDLTLSAKLYDMFTPSEKKDAYSYYGALYDVVERMNSLR